MKGVQCYEFFGGIALKNQAFFYLMLFDYIMLFLPLTFTNAICLHALSLGY